MGDPRQEIEALFTEYGPGVGRYFRARVRDPELAEELTARVFLKVVRKYHQLRGSPIAWLWAIVRTELARYYRDRKEQAAVVEETLLHEASPSDRLSAEEARQHLRSALETLPEEQLTILYFKFFQQMRNGEIAKAIGISASNVGTIMHRALQKLRALMEEKPDPLVETGESSNDAKAPSESQKGI